MSAISRRYAAALTLLVVSLLAGCGGASTPGSYDDDGLKRQFTEGCETQARKDGQPSPSSFCRCSYLKIRAAIDFSDFKAVNDRLKEEPGPLPSSWREAIATCR